MLLSISSVNAENNMTDNVTAGLDEGNGIYVDIHGLDSHDGSQDSPIRTIKKAESLRSARNTNIRDTFFEDDQEENNK